MATHAQQPMQMPQQAEAQAAQQAAYFLEAINLAADVPGKARVDILYRIDTRFFVAVRNTNPDLPSPFVRRGEVLVELFDQKDISNAREIRRIEIGDMNPERVPDQKRWYEGVASLTVDPGEYRVVFEVDDLESTRKRLDNRRKITARVFDGTTRETSTLLFIFPPDPQYPDVITPINFGGEMLFGKGAAVFVQLQSPDLTSDSVRVEYSIATQRFLLRDPTTVVSDTLPAVHVVSAPSPIRLTETPTSYSLAGQPAAQNIRAVIVPLKAEKLPLRPFTMQMKITQGKAEFSLKREFRMVWPDMPQSLRDIDFALEALRHITRPEELDSLKAGSQSTRLTHLEEFWRAKDTTPETEYNEVMVEYYRRVDYAMREFSSLRGDDGYKTDRGRIYILYGPPTKTERMLDPQAGYQEIWTYDKHGKKFVFIDQSKNGNYILVATQNL
jgi:GWxTD domain-containing protein